MGEIKHRFTLNYYLFFTTYKHVPNSINAKKTKVLVVNVRDAVSVKSGATRRCCDRDTERLLPKRRLARRDAADAFFQI